MVHGPFSVPVFAYCRHQERRRVICLSLETYDYEDSDFRYEVVFVAGHLLRFIQSPATNEIEKGNNCHYNFIDYSPIAGDVNKCTVHTKRA